MVKIMNRDDREVVPAVHIVLIEETGNWCDEVRIKAGRLYGVYLFDHRRHVHCCEFTPSYECHFLRTIYTNEFPDSRQGDLDRDALEMEIAEGNRDTPPVAYFHTHEIDALPSISLARWSGKHYREIRNDYDDPEALHGAVMEAMIQMEYEGESDYYRLVKEMK